MNLFVASLAFMYIINFFHCNQICLSLLLNIFKYNVESKVCHEIRKHSNKRLVQLFSVQDFLLLLKNITKSLKKRRRAERVKIFSASIVVDLDCHSMFFGLLTYSDDEGA